MAYLGRQPVIGNFVKLDAITAVNGQAAYTMQNGSVNFADYSTVNQFLVSLNGTIQSPGSSFTVSGSTLTFASNLSTGDVIDFIIVFGNSLSAGVPTDGTVATAKLANDAVTAAKLNSTAITGQTAEATVADDDTVLIHDTSASALRKMTVSNLVANAGGGKVLQVVTATDNTQRATTSGSYVTASNTLTVDITPSATSSKIFVIAHTTGISTTDGKEGRYTIFRDSTDLSGGNGLVFINKNHGSPICMTFLDSPNTTSSTTYAVYVKGESGFETRLNQGSTKGSITAMEIGA